MFIYCLLKSTPCAHWRAFLPSLLYYVGISSHTTPTWNNAVVVVVWKHRLSAVPGAMTISPSYCTRSGLASTADVPIAVRRAIPEPLKNTGAAVNVFVVGDHRPAPTLPPPISSGVEATSVAVAIGLPVAAAAPAFAVYAHSIAP